MKSLGGFLPLELPRPGRACHEGAIALASGRACLHYALRAIRPRRVRVPFYVCDAVCQAIAAVGLTPSFYPIDEQLTARCDLPVSDDDVLVVVNYFGLQTNAVSRWSAASPAVIVDDSQAFFRRGRPDRWSFNSARKTFGVPDGAYLYGPADDSVAFAPSVTGDADHLLVPRPDDDQQALAAFRAHEHRFTAEIRGISPLSRHLLSAIDYEAVRARRRANFAVVHELLGARNRLQLPLDNVAVPLHYPFWPQQRLAHQQLWDVQVFAPRLWPEVEERPAHGFLLERQLASEVLPLPVDQRYDRDDMQEMCRRVALLL